ncbi:MAG: hypothetical protein ACLFWM_07190 [Actinomycetota bacterium]
MKARGAILAWASLILVALTACRTDSAPPGTMAPLTITTGADTTEPAPACTRRVSGEGSDGASGSESRPWATLEHALETIPLTGCRVEVEPGTYRGTRIDRRFTGPAILVSVEPHRARLMGDGTVLDIQGARDVVVEGFELSQDGPGSRGVILNVEDANDFDSERITIRDNIIHDSYEDDLLKIRSGARFVTVQGNVFYNQAPREQHIDVNGVQDIVITDNVFSNDFGASGREDGEDTKAFIVVKDSSATGEELGSRRVRIGRNIFLNWQGGRETFVQVGNDGKPYFEAVDVTVENNLLVGNSPSYATAAFAAAGVKDVTFRHNTVVGDLPSGAYAAFFDRKGENRPNEAIVFRGNVFADPTGTMGDFTNGQEGGIHLEGNLYWNGGGPLDESGPANPGEDPAGVVADPLLPYDHSRVEAIIWDGSSFPSGDSSIRRLFLHLVESYGRVPPESPVIDGGDLSHAPTDDILGNRRDAAPDLGALESP